MIEEDELTYGETIKQPLPELEDIEWVMVKVPEWFFGDRANGLISNQKYNYGELSSWAITSTVYNEMKKVHENSKDFKVTWRLKQTEPHADIKAEYEKAVADGKIVKVFELKKMNQSDYVMNPIYDEVTNPTWNKDDIYKLRFYNIDWSKLLSWSYANGEFVRCQVCELDNFITTRDVRLYGLQIALGRCFIADKGSYKYCRLAPNVTIKDEWLKEVE